MTLILQLHIQYIYCFARGIIANKDKPHSFLMLVHLLISSGKDKPAASGEGGIRICLPVTGANYQGSTVGDKVLKVYKEH